MLMIALPKRGLHGHLGLLYQHHFSILKFDGFQPLLVAFSHPPIRAAKDLSTPLEAKKTRK
jgi:hypothetical protein